MNGEDRPWREIALLAAFTIGVTFCFVLAMQVAHLAHQQQLAETAGAFDDQR